MIDLIILTRHSITSSAFAVDGGVQDMLFWTSTCTTAGAIIIQTNRVHHYLSSLQNSRPVFPSCAVRRSSKAELPMTSLSLAAVLLDSEHQTLSFVRSIRSSGLIVSVNR